MVLCENQAELFRILTGRSKINEYLQRFGIKIIQFARANLDLDFLLHFMKLSCYEINYVHILAPVTK